MHGKVVKVQNRDSVRPGSGRSGGMAAGAAGPLPTWLPDAARLYLHHTEHGVSLRALARTEGVHASTVLRQVRRYESRREDPLVDEALSSLGQACDEAAPATTSGQVGVEATASVDDTTMLAEGRRVRRRLAEPQTVLAIALDMDKAAVLRSFPDGRTVRMAVVDRTVAQAFALKDWIACRKPGRIATYEITSAGRAAVKRMEARGAGMNEAGAIFAVRQPVLSAEVDPEDGERKLRYAAAESPVSVLARRRDKDGRPFLGPELVDAAERLREDFELAQMGPRVTQDWDHFLTGGVGEGLPSGKPGTARERVAAALTDLGPGLGDMVLRCCCYLEGLEAAEQRMGWSARSGKIVLRIALQRLKLHYAETYGKFAPMIG